MSRLILHIGGCADGQWLPDAGKHVARQQFVFPPLPPPDLSVDHLAHVGFKTLHSVYEKHTYATGRDRTDDLEVYVVEGWTPRAAFVHLMRHYRPPNTTPQS